jgi:hypothetical protein
MLVYLYPPSHKNEVLTVDDNGLISFEDKNSGKDNIWILQKLRKGGMSICSQKYQLYLSYDIDKDEEIRALKLDTLTERTRWYVSAKDEIYTTANRDKKYLWVVNKGLYVTSDEHLADPWIFKEIEGRSIKVSVGSPSFKWFKWLLIGLFMLFIIIILIYLYGPKFTLAD